MIAGEGREVPELARAEGEARVPGVAPRVAVGQRGDGERGRVRGHVPAVRHEREGAERRASADLGRHHNQRKPDDEPDAALALGVARTEEDVIVGPGVEGPVVHAEVSGEPIDI